MNSTLTTRTRSTCGLRTSAVGENASTEVLLRTLRAMALERAKAELQAYLATFWTYYDTRGQRIDNGFDKAEQRIAAFIKDMEDSDP